MNPSAGIRLKPLGPKGIHANHLLLEMIGQLSPEIRARQLALDFDLDDVPIRGSIAPIATAMRSLLTSAIEHSAPRGEVAITLIQSNSFWELEIAGRFDANIDGVANAPGSAETSKRCPLTDDAGLRTADAAALAAGGDVEIWRCPQGGSAIVLRVPQRALAGTLKRAA